MTRDWSDWHRAYDDADSMQSRRLAAVVALLDEVFAAARSGPIRVLSLCAGEGRDLVGALRGHPRAGDVSGLLVEADAGLVDRATAALAPLRTGLAVRHADAGAPASFAEVGPVDVLLLCGIFGNVDVADIATTVAAAPALCRPGATIVWTRHRRHPDITPWIRQRFDDAGCPATAWVSPGPGGFALGAQQVPAQRVPAQHVPVQQATVPDRLFTFTTTAEAWGRGRP